MKAALLLLVGLVGLIQTLAPRLVVRAWTALVYRDAGDAEPREWAHLAARAEGAVLTLVSLVGLYRVATAGSDVDETATTLDDRTEE